MSLTRSVRVQLFAVLEIPPIKSATDAVRAAIVADAKMSKKMKYIWLILCGLAFLVLGFAMTHVKPGTDEKPRIVYVALMPSTLLMALFFAILSKHAATSFFPPNGR